MNPKNKNITTEETFKNYPIMTDRETGLSCDTKILTEIERQFEHANNTKRAKAETHPHNLLIVRNLLERIDRNQFNIFFIILIDTPIQIFFTIVAIGFQIVFVIEPVMGMQ